jgi:hypothetical protein
VELLHSLPILSGQPAVGQTNDRRPRGAESNSCGMA